MARPLGFGDVVRVDPETAKVPQPDERRWMIVVPASTSAAREWTMLYIGPDSPFFSLSHWASLTGFIEDTDDVR
jgi:hypothetical protein